MRRAHRLARAAVALPIVAAISALGYMEVGVVLPANRTIRAALAAASPSEVRPPPPVTEMLRRSLGKNLRFQIARQVVAADIRAGEHLGTTRRQLMELALAALLPLHLSKEELSTYYLTSAYLGPGIQGFANASVRYTGTSLDQVTLEQAAELFAIAHAPSFYVGDPERLARRKAFLLGSAGE